jgi:hypothetical protein
MNSLAINAIYLLKYNDTNGQIWSKSVSSSCIICQPTAAAEQNFVICLPNYASRNSNTAKEQQQQDGKWEVESRRIG